MNVCKKLRESGVFCLYGLQARCFSGAFFGDKKDMKKVLG
jgi:hypothetical protein